MRSVSQAGMKYQRVRDTQLFWLYIQVKLSNRVTDGMTQHTNQAQFGLLCFIWDPKW